MPLSCDAARRMVSEALEGRSCIRSLAQLLISLNGMVGKQAVADIVRSARNNDLDQAHILAETMLTSESSWEIPVYSPEQRRPSKSSGALANRVRRHGQT